MFEGLTVGMCVAFGAGVCVGAGVGIWATSIYYDDDNDSLNTVMTNFSSLFRPAVYN
jgi:hypothetical protein